MNIQYLAVNVAEKFDSVGDALAYGLPLSLFGFGVVFAILALLWGILALFKVFFYTLPEKRKNAAPAPAVPAAEKSEAASAIVASVPADAAPAPVLTNDGELVAVLSAAIAAYRSRAGESVGGFRVVSFKKRK